MASTACASRFVQRKAEYTSRMKVWKMSPALSDKGFCGPEKPPNPHSLLSLPPTLTSMLEMSFFGWALKTVPGKRVILTAQGGMELFFDS